MRGQRGLYGMTHWALRITRASRTRPLVPKLLAETQNGISCGRGEPFVCQRREERVYGRSLQHELCSSHIVAPQFEQSNRAGRTVNPTSKCQSSVDVSAAVIGSDQPLGPSTPSFVESTVLWEFAAETWVIYGVLIMRSPFRRPSIRTSQTTT